MFKRRVSTEAKLLIVSLVLFLISISAGAQIDNCCFVDRLCVANDDWFAGYNAYQNGQCAAPTQPEPASSSQPAPAASEAIDNCCFVDRQCSTDEEWLNGYNAYQSNQCAAPSQEQRSSSPQSQPQAGVSEAIDNCCLIGWQCATDAEWTRGYWTYQLNSQCPASSQKERRSSSNSHNPNPVSRTYDSATRTTTFTYEDGVEITARTPTWEEFCEALEREGIPEPECEEN